MNDNVLTMDSGVLADAMQSIRRSLKMADRLAGSYIPPMGGERYLTDKDMAERLHVSRRTLQQYRHEGILPLFPVRRQDALPRERCTEGAGA